MAVIIVGTEKKFAALRSRLIEGRPSRDAVRELTAAVAAANPGVDLDKLELGTILTIPDVPNVTVRSGLTFDDATKNLLEGLAEAAQSVLAELAEAAQARERAAAAERKQLRASLDAREVVALAQQDASFKADLAAVQQAVETEDAQAKARAAALKQAQAEWGAELDAVKRLLG
jgi:hypothetical protein